MTRSCEFEADYRNALLDLMSTRCERTLGRAYEIGRSALRDGMTLLDVVEVHHQAVADQLRREGRGAPVAAALESARCFLREVLAAFEMVHRGCRDANRVLRHFNETLEAEMKRVAHVLHDDTGQLIAAVHLELDQTAATADDIVRRRLQTIRRLLGQVDDQVRSICREMRPSVLEDLGLMAAFEVLRNGVEQRSSLRVHVEGPQDQRFPEAIETSVYRVVQEALTNVVKHAKATTVTIRLESTAERLGCAVRDDGIGFDVEAHASRHGAGGIGLLAMKHRMQRVGGEVWLRSAPGQGTEVCLAVPL